jgi:magnesium chelatase family protein
VRGALAMSLAMQQSQAHARALVLPFDSAQEAALVGAVRVYGARHLLDVVQALKARSSGQGLDESTALGWQRMASTGAPSAAVALPDVADVKGHAAAKRVMEIAAAGGHSLLMVGAPGSGKSMLASRMAGLLPPMSLDESLQSAATLSLAGMFRPEQFGQRTTRAPHHSASAVALVGGGVPPRPGEISLAHKGVLFLDELPEFPRSALEALREPLETGRISIARAHARAEFPAQFQLVAAMNPCPCGYLGSSQKSCRCTPDQVARYQGKLSGPLLDRIDLHIEVQTLATQELLATQASEGSASIRGRVVLARERALKRQGQPNHALAAQDLQTHCELSEAANGFLQKAAQRLGWSSRSTHRAMRVARTIADLAGRAHIETPHLAEAMQYRRALVRGV